MGTIKISNRFLRQVLADYADWRTKWWREAIQNSVDAGAKNVRLSTKVADGEIVTVTCEDDGKGMSREVLLNKFLCLGETGKEGAEAGSGVTGGFGKAKEMLLLPHVSWTVSSGYARVRGVGMDYEVSELSTPQKGVKLSVEMTKGEHTNLTYAENFLAKCSLPGVKFTIDRGELTPPVISASTRTGELVREIEGANVFYTKKTNVSGIWVRANGLFMFDRWAPASFKGRVVVELTAAPTKVLSSNRDSFADQTMRNAFDVLVNELAADTSSALRKKDKLRRRYEGGGKFAVKAKRAKMEEKITAGGLSSPRTAGGGFKAAGKTVREVVMVLQEGAAGEALVSEGTVSLGGASPAVAATILANLPMKEEKVAVALRSLVWEPDFYVINEVEDEGFKPSVRFLPEGMTKANMALAKTWAEIVRLVLITLGYTGEYGVGWVFSDSMRACYLREEGQEWLLLNPYIGEDRKEVLTAENPAHLARIWAYAVHEATHLATGLSQHNEAFSSALTANIAATAEFFPLVTKIAAAIGGGAKVALDEALKLAAVGELLDIAAPPSRRKTN